MSGVPVANLMAGISLPYSDQVDLRRIPQSLLQFYKSLLSSLKRQRLDPNNPLSSRFVYAPSPTHAGTFFCVNVRGESE